MNGHNIKMSLKKQLILYFVIVSFIPASIVSVFYYINSRNSFIAKTIDRDDWEKVDGSVDVFELPNADGLRHIMEFSRFSATIRCNIFLKYDK